MTQLIRRRRDPFEAGVLRGEKAAWDGAIEQADPFWSRVDKTDQCWLWLGRLSTNGYGLFRVGKTEQRAHRVSWEMAHGPIPTGLFVLHHCDVRNCVRPTHLFLGTIADNNADMAAKGRVGRPTWKGADVPTAKLTDAAVADIRAAHAAGVSQGTLARKYGVTQPTVWSAVHRRTWGHVAPPDCLACGDTHTIVYEDEVHLCPWCKP